MRPVIPLGVAVAMSACSPDPRPPVDQLSFEALEKVATDCAKTGAVATDEYCKRANVVYGPKLHRKKEEERLRKVKEREVPTGGSLPNF